MIHFGLKEHRNAQIRRALILVSASRRILDEQPENIRIVPDATTHLDRPETGPSSPATAAQRLQVCMSGKRAAFLERTGPHAFRFQYEPSWLSDRGSFPVSQSLPLQTGAFHEAASRPFFAGLLPEEKMRKRVAEVLRVDPQDEFALLTRMAGECAGAVSAYPARKSPNGPDARTLTPADLAQMLDTLTERPLLAGEDGVRLTLAGSQPKLPVLVTNDGLAVPLRDTPSSHILKPGSRNLQDVVHNEAFCLATAEALGLRTVTPEIRAAGNGHHLLVVRCDRIRQGYGAIQRLHEEDLCQALGCIPEVKYEWQGGPTWADCFALLRRTTHRPDDDCARLLDAAIFSYLIGNNDVHAKNYSITYRDDGIELGPVYDLVSTAVYPNTSQMLAMRIGGQADPAEIYPHHWERFSGDVRLNAGMVRARLLHFARTLPRVSRSVQRAFQAAGNSRPIVDQAILVVDHRAKQTLERFGAAAQD
jgi:serine/threonine-protein kinase HipA